MLIIDRIRHAIHTTRRAGVPTSSTENDFAIDVNRASVYEITNVVPLFDDWVRDREKPIPKKAPSPITWCEWDSPSVFYENKKPLRIGALILEFSGAEGVSFLRGYESLFDDHATEWVGHLDSGGLMYCIVQFRHGPDNVTSMYFPMHFLCFKSDGRYAGELEHMLDNFHSAGYFGLPSETSVSLKNGGFMDTHWPPFMAFSLLHCKNVVTDDRGPTEAFNKRVAKSGNPPRVTFKTISIRVPETVAFERQRSQPGDDHGVRFHLCSGHFKNLKHPRFKNPGLHWWPAHWRGDADKGIVITDRKLIPA